MKRARVTKELRSALRERAWEASRSTKDGSPIPVLISSEVWEAALVEVSAIEKSKSPPRGPCECKDKGERRGYAA